MGSCFSKQPETTAGEPGASSLRNVTSTMGQVSRQVTQGMGAQLSAVGEFLTYRPMGERLNHARNIFVKPLENLVQFDRYQPPVFEKTAAEREFIGKALSKHFVFEGLSHKELKPLVDAFEKISVAKDTVIIKQGDVVGDYFYMLQTGSCQFLVDNKTVGTASPGDCFGELALLYTAPRAATVQATVPATLFRVDQTTFRYILRNQTEKGQTDKEELLRNVDFLKDLQTQDISRLTVVMTPRTFHAGEYLVRKGDPGDNFYILKEGQVAAKNIEVGHSKYEDVTLNSGDYFGERALLTGEPRDADVVALTDGMAFSIEKTTFETVLGNLGDLILRSQDQRRLSAIKVFADSKLDPVILSSLAKLISDRDYKKGTKITEEGKEVNARLFIVRSGKIEIRSKATGTKNIIERGAYFGDDQLLADQEAGNIDGSAKTIAAYTATVLEDCTVGVLPLQRCRRVVDTIQLGKPPKPVNDSLVSRDDLDPKELKRHKILGAGTFGQVWLVSRKTSKGERMAYALKVQSKYELIVDGQANAVVDEKNIMAKLNNPFLMGLVTSYQDDNFVFMVMNLIQGGELYNVMHTATSDRLPEKDTKFYTAVICEGLGYMHRRGYVYRDLKPENVLINAKGYPVIIDFGFAKYVTSKTYTLCGTPLYIAPEVILNRGHNWAADHWSLGCMVYEMLEGETPFYTEGMQQMDLFRAIVKAEFEMPRKVSPEGASMLTGFITKSPSKRLGSLAGGEDDILGHAWFASIDFDKLRDQEIKAPFVPKIKNPLDGSNFDDWSHLEDKTKQKYPKLTREQAAVFAKF